MVEWNKKIILIYVYGAEFEFIWALSVIFVLMED